MPPALLIIADDLTGANDTGVQFAQRGIEVIVSIHPEQSLAAFANDCQVLVVNTESRHLPPAEAFARVFRVAQQGVALGIAQFYKKTDSTLRGNIGSELAALLAATGAQQLFFAPAYPKLKRTTRQGIQYVDAVPLSQSSFANDPLNPCHEAFIPTIITRQTNIAVKLFETWPDNVQTKTIYVVDAATDDDLRTAARLLNTQKLLAGSAGWAEFLSAAMAVTIAPKQPATVAAPLLLVNGSLHETSLRQVAYAAQTGVPVVELRAADLSHQVVAELKTKLATEQCVVLTTCATHPCAQAAQHLARIVSDVLDQSTLKTLVVFGGDTLAAIAAARGWQAFRLQAELVPGVPWGTVCGPDDLLLLTKAGGFGAVNLLDFFMPQ